MKTGFAKIEITPPIGSNMNGYYHERYSEYVVDPLYVTAVAYSDGENTALTISLDISEILQRDTNDIRSKVSKYTGIPFEAVFLACIHTHTAPVISEIPGFFKRDEKYYNDFCDKICLCAAEAINDMKDSVVSIARGEVEGITFIRRYRMKDGSTVTNPSLNILDQVSGPIGEPDKTVQLIKIQREDAPDIAIVHYANHPDVVGGRGICPDWPGFMRDTVEAALAKEANGKGVRVIFFNGAQGDINQWNSMKGEYPKGVEHSRYMGRVLAGVVLSIYTYTEPVSCELVRFKQNMARVATAKGTEEDVEKAKLLNEKFVTQKEKTLSEYSFNDVVMARKYIRLEESEPLVDLNVLCISLGDIVFVGLPGEPFTDIGRQIKENSPFSMTLVCCNANGSEGYFLTDEALNENGYETSSALFLPGVASELIHTSLKTLQELKK
jgi:hypothetical protein